MTATDPWVLIDASNEGEIRVALADRDGPGKTIWRHDERELPTFTDALIRFSEATGTALLGRQAALAAAGAISGDTITITRSRRVISRRGLASLFGRPVEVVNDVAAAAWATLDGPGTRHHLHGPPAVAAAAAATPQRTLLIKVDEGVGAAVIDVHADGGVTVLETEAGHVDFAPATDAEAALAAGLRRNGEQPSWERVLLPALSGVTMSDLDASRLLGRFAGNLALAAAAWQGVMLTGRLTALLSAGAAPRRSAFSQGFAMRQTLRRQLEATPCCTIELEEPVLVGLTKLLAQRCEATA